MPIRFILLGILLTIAASVNAAERFLLNLELTQGKNKIEMGRTFVSQKPHTWSKGSKRSYLKLGCHQQESGKTQKLYSTVDHFAGLRVTHQLAGNNVELTVVRNVVQPRLVEIRALAKNKCKDLSPIVTTISESYIFPAKDGIDEARPFGENMTFRVTLQSAEWNR